MTVRVAEDEPRRSALGVALQAVVLVLLLSILAAVLLVLFAVASLLRAPEQLAGGIGAQLGSASSQALSGAQQAIQNATDPNHPPSGLNYDTEFRAIDIWHVGEGLPGGTQYVLTVKSIERRAGSSSPQTALYAVIHAELREPRQTRFLGQVIRSDSDPHDHVVYTGETFRIGRSLYRVNWISQVDESVAAGVLRQPDASTQPLKFEYE